LTDTKFITEEEYQIIQKRCRIETGDVLLTKSGSLVQIAYAGVFCVAKFGKQLAAANILASKFSF